MKNFKTEPVKELSEFSAKDQSDERLLRAHPYYSTRTVCDRSLLANIIRLRTKVLSEYREENIT